jgi:hypothetical protein
MLGRRTPKGNTMRTLLLASALVLLNGCGPASSQGGFAAAADDDDDATEAPPPEGLDDNFWPLPVAPLDYEGTGLAVGETVPAWVFPDQYGNDAGMRQFWGGMTLLAVGASWCEPCRMLSAAMPTIEDGVADAVDGPLFWSIELLVEGSTGGRVSTEADAAAWSSTYSASGPVLWGADAHAVLLDYGITTLPSIYVVDPMLEVREVIPGHPGAAALIDSVRGAWEAFAEENPDWSNPYPFEEYPGHP